MFWYLAGPAIVLLIVALVAIIRLAWIEVSKVDEV